MYRNCFFVFLCLFSCNFMQAGNYFGVYTGGETSKDSLSRQEYYDHLDRLNESQLIDLIDSLISAPSISCELVVHINKLITIHENANPKNNFVNFSIYPSQNIYGKWDTKNLFPYDKELSKNDSTICLSLTGDAHAQYVHPVIGPVTSGFGWRDSADHKGIDIDLNRGDTVRCAFDGMVRVAMRTSCGYGNVMIVRHYNGLETLYAHLYKLKVKPGDFVFAGQMIGSGGSTGRSTGSHLHFETRYKGVPINPKYFISFEEHTLLSPDVELKKMRWGYAAYPASTNFYTVQKGDNLYDLAKRYGTSVAFLKEINGFTRYPRLKAGDKLVVRKTEAHF